SDLSSSSPAYMLNNVGLDCRA
ncbi:hypothetical protein BV898_19723, partial [Hypsibius exemplaris]